MAMGRSPWFDYERDCEPWQHRRPERLSRVPLYRNGENDDADLMTKDELFQRRFEGEMMHRYGDKYLYSITDGDFPVVVVGNPEQRVLVNDCRHEHWRETYNGAECPDCGKVF